MKSGLSAKENNMLSELGLIQRNKKKVPVHKPVLINLEVKVDKELESGHLQVNFQGINHEHCWEECYMHV